MFNRSFRGQGSLEYLLVIGLVILVSAVVITVVPSSLVSPSKQISGVGSAYDSLRGAKGVSGIVVMDVVGGLEVGGNVLSIKNSSGGSLVLKSVSSVNGGVSYFSGSVGVASGGSVDVNLSNAGGCSCSSPCSYVLQFDLGRLVVSGSSVSCSDGSFMNPFFISNCSQLKNISNNLNKNFTVTSDFDCSGSGYFVPLGSDAVPFSGSLDGGGKTISGLAFDASGSGVGLFGVGSSSAVVQNLNLANVNIHLGGIDGRSSESRRISFDALSDTCTGGLAQKWSGGVHNVKFSSYAYTLTGRAGNSGVGGLVGCLYGGSISNSSSSMNVASIVDNAGGLVGKNVGGVITDSNATGAVSGINNVGGLVGNNSDGASVSGSFASGAVNSSGDTVGGLVGYNGNQSGISTSFASGVVTSSGNQNVGGLVGTNDNSSTIRSSFATGEVNVTAGYVGGLLGRNDFSSVVSDCFASGKVTGNNGTGGLVGFNEMSFVTNSFASGPVTGNNNVGGLVGYNYFSSVVTGSFSTGSVSGGSYNSPVGGLVGQNSAGYLIGSSIVNSFWFGDPDWSSYCYSGGPPFGDSNCSERTKLSDFFVSTNAPMASWDFVNVWHANEGAYPTLIWQHN